MICLSSSTVDSQGTISFEHSRQESTLRNLTARISVIKTTDGGTVVTSNGVTDKDRTIAICANINKIQEKQFWYLFKTHSRFILSVETELFYCAIKSLKTDRGKLKLNIIIIETEV